jgi:hypothetical protein
LEHAKLHPLSRNKLLSRPSRPYRHSTKTGYNTGGGCGSPACLPAHTQTRHSTKAGYEFGGLANMRVRCGAHSTSYPNRHSTKTGYDSGGGFGTPARLPAPTQTRHSTKAGYKFGGKANKPLHCGDHITSHQSSHSTKTGYYSGGRSVSLRAPFSTPFSSKLGGHLHALHGTNPDDGNEVLQVLILEQVHVVDFHQCSGDATLDPGVVPLLLPVPVLVLEVRL